MRKLFLSFTSLIFLIRDGKITQEDLDNGLYYFGCTFGHTQEKDWYPDDARRAAHNQIGEAVRRAVAENRAVFRDLVEHCSFTQLNDLLATNGYPKIEFAFEGLQKYDFSKPDAEDRIRDQGIPLEVVWN